MPDAPADTIRQAATRMRHRAQAATPGPWESVTDNHGNGPEHSIWSEPESKYVIEGHRYVSAIPSGPDAEHIAAMNPLVAIALADWLDAELHVHQQAGALAAAATSGEVHVGGSPMRFEVGLSTFDKALAVARAYLREDDS